MFVFAPDGTIPISFFNVPGCIHNSQVADWGCIYQKLEGLWEKYEVRCVMDSAFGKIECQFIIKSSQDYMSSNQLSRSEQLRDIQEKKAATSMQQTAEWGMRGLQASFPVGKIVLYMKKEVSEGLTKICARMVGINQICNVYMPFLNWNANAEYVV